MYFAVVGVGIKRNQPLMTPHQQLKRTLAKVIGFYSCWCRLRKKDEVVCVTPTTAEDFCLPLLVLELKKTSR
jgi:hypothetical protein